MIIFRNGIQYPGFDAVDVDGLETITAVAFNALAVALHQNIRANFCVLTRNAICNECILHKTADLFP